MRRATFELKKCESKHFRGENESKHRQRKFALEAQQKIRSTGAKIHHLAGGGAPPYRWASTQEGGTAAAGRCSTR
jgi:hypothetical protein